MIEGYGSSLKSPIAVQLRQLFQSPLAMIRNEKQKQFVVIILSIARVAKKERAICTQLKFSGRVSMIGAGLLVTAPV
jgi:hypothetical protein